MRFKILGGVLFLLLASFSILGAEEKNDSSMKEVLEMNKKLLQRVESLEKRVVELEDEVAKTPVIPQSEPRTAFHPSLETPPQSSAESSQGGSPLKASQSSQLCLPVEAPQTAQLSPMPTNGQPSSSSVIAAIPTQISIASKPVKVPPSEDKPVKSKLGMNPYGYVKLDAIFDDSTAYPGNIGLYIPSEGVKKDDGKFYLTVNQTRLGVNIPSFQEGKAKVSGRLEYDFYGAYPNSVAPENKSEVMLRHAYVNLEWPDQDFSILGGQTWDVISPLNPNTLNYGPMLDSGNIGYRRPQLRLSKGFKASSNSKWTLQMAAVRTLGKSDVFLAGTGDAGIDAGSPTFQSRVAYSFPTYSKAAKAEIGIYGHSGAEEYDYLANGDNKKVFSRSTGFDVKVPLSKQFTIQGEGYSGQNLDTYYGGIGQGILVSTMGKNSGTIYSAINVASGTSANTDFLGVQALKSHGGWMELNFGPFKRWQWNVGFAMEKMDDDNLPGSARSKNDSRWINTFYDLNEATQVCLEFAHCTTSYKSLADGTNNRIQSALMYKF
ncbi:MAG: hypothetical protein HQM08_11230 [Candidatus Riflebacteria bacterium]|nr:hypothetical protein [Candidatus Riflebacteria bacterium]